MKQEVFKDMVEKCMSKFSQHLATNDLIDAYFQEVFNFFSIYSRKNPSRLEDTFDKKKNWKTALRNQ